MQYFMLSSKVVCLLMLSTQKGKSDDTSDTQLSMHVLVSCPDHVHLLARDSLVNQVNLMGPIPRRTNEIVRLLLSM